MRRVLAILLVLGAAAVATARAGSEDAGKGSYTVELDTRR
jgi:hypothetical protein